MSERLKIHLRPNSRWQMVASSKMKSQLLSRGFVWFCWNLMCECSAGPSSIPRDWGREWLVGRASSSLNAALTATFFGYYRAAWNADAVLRWDLCMSVCPSVCPSGKTRALWQNWGKICPDCYTMRKIVQSSFMTRRMVRGGRPLLPEILGQPADFEPIIARSASSVRPSEKSSINTNRKSPTRFQRA